MSDQIPLTLDTFFAGEALDLVNLAADLGTDRDRGQLGDTAYAGLDYGRDIMLLLDGGFPAVSIQQEIGKSPALVGLGATVTVSGVVGVVETLDAVLEYQIGGLARATYPA